MITIQGKCANINIMSDVVDLPTMSDLYKMANNESFHEPIVIMPDVHAGKGAVIGFTMPLRDSVIPNIVGVDIGCGVMATRIKNTHIDFRDLDLFLRDQIPMGQKVNGEAVFDLEYDFDYRAFQCIINQFLNLFYSRYDNIIRKTVKIDYDWVVKRIIGVNGNVGYVEKSVLSLGGGNHYLSIEENINGNRLFVVHTGSRNFGLLTAEYWQNIAISKNKASDKTLAPLHGEDFLNYMLDMLLAQYLAHLNRVYITNKACEYLEIDENHDRIESVHNFIDPSDWIVRKGAIRNYPGEIGVIPLNMRDGLLLFEGNGNKDWNFSCPHGAGRVYSRSKAKEKLDFHQFQKDMEGIYCSTLGEDVLDESPRAYKDKEVIINALISDCGITKLEHYKTIYVAKSGKVRM